MTYNINIIHKYRTKCTVEYYANRIGSSKLHTVCISCKAVAYSYRLYWQPLAILVTLYTYIARSSLCSRKEERQRLYLSVWISHHKEVACLAHLQSRCSLTTILLNIHPCSTVLPQRWHTYTTLCKVVTTVNTLGAIILHVKFHNIIIGCRYLVPCHCKVVGTHFLSSKIHRHTLDKCQRQCAYSSSGRLGCVAAYASSKLYIILGVWLQTFYYKSIRSSKLNIGILRYSLACAAHHLIYIKDITRSLAGGLP